LLDTDIEVLRFSEVRRQTGVHQLFRAATAFTSGLFKSDLDLLLLADTGAVK
jgi:hypothetical protein